jgi:hypothetical protein
VSSWLAVVEQLIQFTDFDMGLYKMLQLSAARPQRVSDVENCRLVDVSEAIACPELVASIRS